MWTLFLPAHRYKARLLFIAKVAVVPSVITNVFLTWSMTFFAFRKRSDLLRWNRRSLNGCLFSSSPELAVVYPGSLPKSLNFPIAIVRFVLLLRIKANICRRDWMHLVFFCWGGGKDCWGAERKNWRVNNVCLPLGLFFNATTCCLSRKNGALAQYGADTNQ